MVCFYLKLKRVLEFHRSQSLCVQVWEKAGATGLLGVGTSADVGGVGADFLSTAIVWEEQ